VQAQPRHASNIQKIVWGASEDEKPYTVSNGGATAPGQHDRQWVPTISDQKHRDQKQGKTFYHREWYQIGTKSEEKLIAHSVDS
jgi:hypothetical protein